jgi:acetyltransferase-like isoleucine patch superfamily enzyme
MGRAFQNKIENKSKKELKKNFKTFLSKLFGLLIQITFSNEIRVFFCKKMGVNVGKDVFIGKYCIIDDTFPELITIEDGVNMSFGVTIVAHDASKDEVAGVLIKRGAYLGTRSVILPGVIIGEKSVIGAGAVVTSDVQPETKVAGVPARIIEQSEKNMI